MFDKMSPMRMQPHRLDDALDKLAAASDVTRVTHQTTVFQIAEMLLSSDEGMQALLERADRFDEVGVFTGGPWHDPARLQPALVEGGLLGAGVYPVVEALSELRVAAIATGRCEHPGMSRDDAQQFLESVMALNLRWVFPQATEEDRMVPEPRRAAIVRLFQLLAREVGLQNLREQVIDEIEQQAAQRPIQTDGLRRTILLATAIPAPGRFKTDRLRPYVDAVSGPSTMSRRYADLADYRARIRKASARTLASEARAFASSMQQTGLCCPHHAVLVRRARHDPALLGTALGLSDAGQGQLEQQTEEIANVVVAAILPSTCQALYGLSQMVERGLFSRNEIRVGLDRLVTLDLIPDVRERLLLHHQGDDVPSANAVLLAGAVSVLGQPLGVGQGNNPTCQSARAISMWAQHAPGFLLEAVVSAARDGLIEMNFEGASIRSDLLLGGVATTIDDDLDPVSAVLVRHLDRLYDEMMRRVALRHEDGHKWVNPELYGRGVPRGFASVFADRAQTTIAGFGAFVRRFYATHHPDYNDGHTMMYANPVGICVTNGHGYYLGPHAVTVQRVAEDPAGDLRVYFYNPNNEGRQDWGHGVKPSIRGAGEEEGESSLRFAEFASRLYAFHYNPYEEGDAFAVPAEDVARVREAARSSWGRAFQWQ